MLTMILMLAWTLPLIFLFLSHPLSFGLILLMQTLVVSMITGMMNYNFWFSYILFLVMVGGMLILFIYMTSIASNEKFKFSQNMFLTTIIMLLTSIIIIMVTDQYFISHMSTMDLINQETPYSNQMSMTKYLNMPSHSILYMMFIYLLITLIMVVKITNIQYGPLRQKF